VERSDPELIDACLHGKQAAWNALIDRYARLIYSVPRRYGLNEADADDVFQAVCVSLYRSLDKLKDQQRLSAWLLTTAHRESWRVGKRAGEYPELDKIIDNVAAPEDDQVAAWERQHAVQQALKQLGGPCEKLLRALFMDSDQPDYQTIAARLGMKVGSIGPTRARCFAKLERIIAKMGIWPEEVGAGRISDP